MEITKIGGLIMIERHIKEVIDYSLKHFPCVVLTGPRQVGKTTLLTEKYEGRGFSYVTLDNTPDRLLAQNDPKTFLSIHPYPLIIDEAQKATQLFEEIEYIINEKRRHEGNDAANGMFILSGSSRIDLLEKAKESLAGRVAFLDMSPLSLSEIYGRDNLPFIPDPKILSKRINNISLNQDELLDLIVKGQMPELYADKGIRGSIFYSSFISTYLDKDIRTEIDLRDESKFYNLIVLLASLTGQELNYDSLSKQVGVTAMTIKSWVSVMAKTGIVHLLQPYYEESWTKRIVKSPKIYFFDTGIASYLLGIDSKETLSKSFLKGRLFETFVVNEIRKTYDNAGDKTNFFYYRDYNQNEIDIVFVKKGTIYPIECKFGETHKLSEVSGFKELKNTHYSLAKASIVCSSESISALSENVLIIPVKSI